MNTLKNILTIAGLGLITSLNLNAQDTTKFYNSQGRLERKIIKYKENDLEKKDTIYYKYNSEGKLIEQIRKMMFNEGQIDYSIKMDENGREIESIQREDINDDGKFDKKMKSVPYYDDSGNLIKKVFYMDNNNDGIYEKENDCICKINKEIV